MPLNGLKIIERTEVVDQRGAFERLFCADSLERLINSKPVKQISRSQTEHAGVVRGMHFQYPPFAETKIVTCIQGDIFDVVVDLRKGSTSFLKWFGINLHSSGCKTLLIPEGFAHGFQTLSPNCEVLYFTTASYTPTAEGLVNALDPLIGIKWPLEISSRSARDSTRPMLDANFKGIEL